MDVGATVGNIALYTAFFACLSYIALSVELGQSPKVDKKHKKKGAGSFLGFLKKKKDKKETSSQEFEVEDITPENKEKAQSTEASMNSASLDKTLDTTSAALTDGIVRSKLNEEIEGVNLVSLRSKYIDGFLGPRIKYDVALTTLYESHNKKVEKSDEGFDVASQAFLEATQSIVFTED